MVTIRTCTLFSMTLGGTVKPGGRPTSRREPGFQGILKIVRRVRYIIREVHDLHFNDLEWTVVLSVRFTEHGLLNLRYQFLLGSIVTLG